MTEEKTDKIYISYMSATREKLDKALDTGHAGSVHSVACDIAHELVREIIRLKSELEKTITK